MTSSGILHSSNIQTRLRHTILSMEKGLCNLKSVSQQLIAFYGKNDKEVTL